MSLAVASGPVSPGDVDGLNVVWKPLPGSQSLAISCPCNVILYEGSRGPGKTDAQIMAFRSRVGKGYGKFWRGIIFDREYKNLDDLIAKSERWFPAFKDGARFLRSKADYRWVWPTGEELLFRQFKRDADYWNYHGQEFPFIGWNELTKFATSKPFDLMLSCSRTGFVPEEHTPRKPDGSFDTPDGKPLPDIPLQVFATTNSYGPGHIWCKKRFVSVAAPGKIVSETTNVYNPRTGKREDVTRTQVRLFGSYRENRYLSPAYVAVLEGITDPNRRAAWLHGSWDIVSGGALDGAWSEDHNVIEPFPIPKAWRINRAFDWGSSHPFSVGWYAEANGEQITLPSGRIFAPRPGSLIRFAEWYGATAEGTNEGLRLSAPEIAEGVLEREMRMLKKGLIVGIPEPGPADTQIFQMRERDVPSIARKMAGEGVEWTPADQSKDTRVNGLELVRNYLIASKTGEGPGIYFTRDCQHAISLLPTIPRDEEKPDDVDTTSEDHIYDEVRYRVLEVNRRLKRPPKVTFTT